MRIAYLILHYMAGDDTIECVNSILKITKKSEHETAIIIVDNGSTNDSFAKLSVEFESNKNIKLIHSDLNLGFAKGNNLGFYYAKYEWKADFIVQLNNDTVLSQMDFNEIIVEKYDESKYAVLGPDIITADGFHQNPGKSAKWTQKQIIRFRLKKWIQYFMSHFQCFDCFLKLNEGSYLRNCVNVDVCGTTLHGACLIFSKQFIDKFDGLCDRTFLYMEEDILKLQADHFGLRMMYTPDLKLYHKEDAATNMVAASCLTKKKRVYKNLLDSSKVYLQLMKEYSKDKRNDT